MAKHHEPTGKHAAHQPAFVQAIDPSLDPNNEVQFGKAWVDTSGGTGNWVLKIRNEDNDGWETL